MGMKKIVAPALSWLRNLPEVGGPIARFAVREEELLARRADLQQQIDAIDMDVAKLRAQAEVEAKKLWRAAEIRDAKARAKDAA